MVGINDESGRNHRLFPTWHEYFDEVKPAMKNAICMGASEHDPRSIYIKPRAKVKDGPELPYGEQLLQSYKRSIPSAKAQQARFRTLRKLETILEPRPANRDGSGPYKGNTERWQDGPRYVIGLHGSVILNLDDDGSDLDIVIMDRKYTDGAWPSDFAAEREALHNLVSIHDIFDGRRGLETLSFTGSTIHMVDREKQGEEIYVNITLNALHLMYSTLLIRQYALMRPLTFLPLCHFLHRLLDERRNVQYRRGRTDGNDPTLLGHHVANLLVLFHLQTSATPDWPLPILHSADAISQSRAGVWSEHLRIPREETRDTWVGKVSYCWPLPFGWSLADKLTRIADDKAEEAEREARRRQKALAKIEREAEEKRKRKVALSQSHGKNAQKRRRLPGDDRAVSYPASVVQSESDDSDDDIVSMRPRCPSVSVERSSGGQSDSEDYDSEVEETITHRGITFTDDQRRQPTPLLSGSVTDLVVKGEPIETDGLTRALDTAVAKRRFTCELSRHEDSPAPIPSHLKGKQRAIYSPAPPSPSSPETPVPRTEPVLAPQQAHRSVASNAMPSASAARHAARPPTPEPPDLVEPAERLEEELLSLLYFLQTLDPKTQPVRVQLGRDSTRADWERDRLQGMGRSRALAGSFADEVVIEDAVQPGWNLTPNLPARVLESLGADCARILEEMASDEIRPLSELLCLALSPISPPTLPPHRQAPYRPSPPSHHQSPAMPHSVPLTDRQQASPPLSQDFSAAGPSRHDSQASRQSHGPTGDEGIRQSTPRNQTQRRTSPPPAEVPRWSTRPQQSEPRLLRQPAPPVEGWTRHTNGQDLRRMGRPTTTEMFPQGPAAADRPPRRDKSLSPVLPASPPPPVATRALASASPAPAPPQAQPKPKRVWRGAPTAMRGTGAPLAPLK